MSSISAGIATGTALVSTGDTSGALQLQVNGTTPSVTLAANGSIGVGSTPGYGTNGQVLTSAGTGSAPTWTTPASATAATQAQMEAASSNTVFATPLNTNFSPGVAKAWLKCDAAGAIQVSHNITSITDDGTGLVTVTIATDFSSAEYAILLTAQAAQGNQRTLQVSNNTIPTAGAFTLISFNDGGTLFDATHYFAACFGDQA
jgi:hypothetical protein